MALYGSVIGALAWLGIDPMPWIPEGPPLNLVGFLVAVVVAPIVETALLGALLAAMQNAGVPKVRAAGLAAVLWGVLHGAVAPLWFFGTVWSFFVMSAAYLAWLPVSHARAFAAAAVPHALINALVLSVVIADERL